MADANTTGSGSAGLPMAVLVFVFGLAAGFLAAFAGLGFFADNATTVIGAFLTALIVAALASLALLLLRRRLMRSLFGFADAEVERFTAPLARVADAAIARDPAAASAAARELVQLALARYAWLATRRWVVVSLTALIAAMAALAGTALLFKQNQLIAAQSELLAGQNQRIDQQTRLLLQDVELAEAARNAELAVAITEIAAEVGALADAAAGVRSARGAAPADTTAQLVNALDPMTDVPGGLLQRIVAASQALRPYRFLQSGFRPGDDADKLQRAILRRRGQLPQTYARMAEGLGWSDLQEGSELIDRPASPERGQLLTALVQGGIRNFEILNHFGLDLSFAWLPDATLLMVTLQGGQLSYADFSGADLNGCDLGGAFLENSRFRRATLYNTSFATVDDSRVRPPWPPGYSYVTQLSGADFDDAVLVETSFAGANGLAATFVRATLMRPDFTGAVLAAGSFEGAVLIAPVWDGADLRSTEFDGAVMFGEDALSRIAEVAAPDSFKPGNWELQPIAIDEVLQVATAYATFTADEIAQAAGAPPFRVRRIAGGESGR